MISSPPQLRILDHTGREVEGNKVCGIGQAGPLLLTLPMDSSRRRKGAFPPLCYVLATLPDGFPIEQGEKWAILWAAGDSSSSFLRRTFLTPSAPNAIIPGVVL